MCKYCEKGHYVAMEDETDSRGQRTIISASITGDVVCVERKKVSATGTCKSYQPLCYGTIRHCPMCGMQLKGRKRA